MLPQKPDLVIMESVLPDGSGFELMRDIRFSTTAYVVVLTKDGSEDEELEWLVRGADQYITKPCSAQVLYHRVMAVLRRGGSRNRESVEAVLDTSLRMASVHAAVITDVRLTLTHIRITIDNGDDFAVNFDALAGVPGYEALWKGGVIQ